MRLRVAFALLMAAAGSFAADPAVPLNEAGIRELSLGHADGARKAFEEALEEHPDALVLRRNLAAALACCGEERLRDRDVGEALRLLERATRLHPSRIAYRVLLARARLAGGDDGLREAARADLELALAGDPDHLEALEGLARIAYVDRDLDAAIVRWRRASELRPGDAGILRSLADAERERQVEASFVEIPGPFFRLRYSPGIAPDRAQAVLVLCEEARGRLGALYGTYPPRIVVTLYTPAEFRNVTALHGWVKGVSDGTIRLSLGSRDDPGRLAGTIVHEMTHHVIRAIAPGAPVWLHEGLAQIEEGRSAEEAAARLRDAGELPDTLLSAAILAEGDPRRVAVFYDTALAFARYLDDGQRGALLRLLRELGAGKGEAEAFRDVFGESRETLFEKWRAGLR
ncbi:MAG TPA: hypothetical protein VFY93_17275 [Planctomycetota bacterium]|nr:hypothetical protein [Planctomycetota bacterium]